MSFSSVARASRRLPRTLTRGLSNHAGPLPSSAYMNSSKTADPAVSGTPTDLTAEQRDILHSSLRVDQVGEVAADYIYRGQLAVLKNDPKCGPIIQEMWNQEKKHLAVMHKLRAQHDVRPTALWEVAKVAGFGLGAVSALLGREAAMACTEAVETVIGEHYDDQLKELAELPQTHPSVPLLQGVVREFRDDELEHLDTAVEHHSQRAPGHALLSTVVGLGCKAAIELCKRV